jgi:hypothetical protein
MRVGTATRHLQWAYIGAHDASPATSDSPWVCRAGYIGPAVALYSHREWAE